MAKKPKRPARTSGKRTKARPKAKARTRVKARAKSKTRSASKPADQRYVDVTSKDAERLRQMGAHGMSVKQSAQGPVLEVYVAENFGGDLPSSVAGTVKGTTLKVKKKKAPRFKAEKF